MTSDVFDGVYDGSLSFIHRVDKISTGLGEFYTVVPGDKYHFYYSFIDSDGEHYQASWTADIVE